MSQKIAIEPVTRYRVGHFIGGKWQGAAPVVFPLGGVAIYGQTTELSSSAFHIRHYRRRANADFSQLGSGCSTPGVDG